MPVDSTLAFLDLFRRSELFDAAGYARLFPRAGDLPADPRDCAAALVQAGLLSSYQASQLLQGRHRGFVLGPYKILQPIGKGGMGAVFLAEHTAMKRRVALKVLQFDRAQATLALERFRREARSAAALDHPNIVLLFDVGEQGRVHYLAMEFIDGETLDGLLARGSPPPFTQAVAYICQAAAGLQHAHVRGLVHRDVKPSNLILTKDGTVKLLDLGLARSCSDRADNLTASLGTNSDAVGTVDFVSPEQALNAEVDARSDIYSLGATLYALIAGNPPFQGTVLQKLAQHQTVDPPPLSSLRPEVPEGLSQVVARMMAKKPARRYASAAEVIEALSPWLPGAKKRSASIAAAPRAPAPEVAPPIAPSVRLKERQPGRKARPVRIARDDDGPSGGVIALVAGIALIVLVCLAGVIWLIFRPPAGTVEPAPRVAQPDEPPGRLPEPPPEDPGVVPVGADGKPLNLDFETGTLKDWTAEGDAFKDQPVRGDTVRARRFDMRSLHKGDYWIGTYERGGDGPQGTLTSVAFKVTHPYASFLVGGGADPTTCVELVLKETGEVFHRASGRDVENMRREVVDLGRVQGKEMFIRLVDRHSGHWGHINFDDFRFHEKKPAFVVPGLYPGR
jgi:tRNA A-37 threonylcarbamoyl transferase component Bud32